MAWDTVLVGVLAVAGVLWTQWRADKRMDQRRADDVARENRLAARDAVARLFDHKRRAYITFYKKSHKYYTYARRGYLHTDHLEALDDPDYFDPFDEALTDVSIYGSEVAAQVARDLYFAYEMYLDDHDGVGESILKQRREAFTAVIRDELGITASATLVERRGAATE